MAKKIVILGSNDHARAVQGCLIGMGHEVALFDTRAHWDIYGKADEGLYLETPGGEMLGYKDIAAFYWNNHDGVLCSPSAHKFAEHNRRSALDSWLKWIELRGVPMYNSYSAFQMHQTKAYQTMVIEKHLKDNPHVEQPATVFGNEFASSDGWIRKGIQGGTSTVMDGEAWDDSIISQRQPRMKGDTYRVYVTPRLCINYRVVAKTLDYRDDPTAQTVLHEKHDENMVIGCRDLVKGLGWKWAGIDLIHDGIWWLLDVNPSPWFLSFGKGEVLKAFCEELASHE